MKPVLAIVPDLFFAEKLAATARASGIDLRFTAPAEAPARCAAEPPARVLVDLHAPGALDAVRALSGLDAARGIPVIGFYSHVETSLRQQALSAGVTEALPRSAFVARLPALLGAAGQDSED